MSPIQTPDLILFACILVLFVCVLVSTALYQKARLAQVTAESRVRDLEDWESTAKTLIEAVEATKLPPIHVEPCDEPEFAGWVQVDVGEHMDCVRICVRFVEDGDKTEHGDRLLRILAAHAKAVE